MSTAWRNGRIRALAYANSVPLEAVRNPGARFWLASFQGQRACTTLAVQRCAAVA
jgi:hypothetical protein